MESLFSERVEYSLMILEAISRGKEKGVNRKEICEQIGISMYELKKYLHIVLSAQLITVCKKRFVFQEEFYQASLYDLIDHADLGVRIGRQNIYSPLFRNKKTILKTAHCAKKTKEEVILLLKKIKLATIFDLPYKKKKEPQYEDWLAAVCTASIPFNNPF